MSAASYADDGCSVAAEQPQSDNTFAYILEHESREKAKENWRKFGCGGRVAAAANNRGVTRADQDRR